ncbi:MAG: hypothetical protein P8Q93_03505 [Ascidiaceihabitans sp.]|jgi:hypothetical protein|nr:hypothetical protein [Ascidiaceihabitans sp.]MDA9135969.1 hypothetical protein [Ascidiaceihabitans sp.]MDA9352233.1 hypothetical protein [Ascidiaceihabitans sp.]MDB4073890.1 hypothetical protein [Ascidiaceihabitans sp.]MDB9945406.1 hypothetical protein [Ascidiaceihabitans sp.]MDC1275789.1 hypothetical protein [Ascidiaceihabitans sp.]
MGSIWWLIIGVATIIPMLKLLPFFGINKYWAAICILPIGTVGLIWWMSIKLQELEKR